MAPNLPAPSWLWYHTPGPCNEDEGGNDAIRYSGRDRGNESAGSG